MLLNVCDMLLRGRSRILVTTLGAARSKKLHGLHVHKLFGFPVNQQENNSAYSLNKVTRLVQSSLRFLTKNPGRVHVLQSAELLCIDEAGLFSETLLRAVDRVLRKIRECDGPFGGLHVIVTGDQSQQFSQENDVVWKSSWLMLHFTPFCFNTESFRTVDTQLKTLNDLLRRREVTDRDFDRIWTIVTNNCVFHQSFEDISEGVPFVGPTHNAVKAVEAEFQRRRQTGAPRFSNRAEDTLMRGGHRVPIPEHLRRRCRAFRQWAYLEFDIGAVVKCVQNLPNAAALNGHIGTITSFNHDTRRINVNFYGYGEAQMDRSKQKLP